VASPAILASPSTIRPVPLSDVRRCEPWSPAKAPFVGRSAAFRSLVRELERFARFEIPVLLTGETGTGKSHAATILHARSNRSSRCLLEVNCNTLPEALIESELFGCVAGAHSTATRPLAGKVAAAAGGTLFLDEIGDLPLSAQGKLLQLLETGVYFPLGSAKPCRANARIVAATNVHLESAVRDRRFREDLYFRLNMAEVRLPDLASRSEDIAPLAEHFCASACERHGLPPLRLSSALLGFLEKQSWRGNVRELEHCVGVACIRCACEGACEVEPVHVRPREHSVSVLRSEDDADSGLHEGTREFQRRLIGRALKSEDGNVSRAARRLRMSRSHLYTLMGELQIAFRRGREALQRETIAYAERAVKY
jgi:Nif-specific regulatory protein